MRLTARALFWLLAGAVLVRTRGGQHTARRGLRTPAPARHDAARARTIALATHRAARLLRPSPSCLSRALAAGRLLSSEGLEARVTLGVAGAADGAGAFAAHAWLAHGPLVLSGEPTARRYTPLCAIETSADPAFVPLA